MAGDHVERVPASAVEVAAKAVSYRGWTHRLTRLVGIRYLGSHPTISGQHENLTLTFFDAGIHIVAGRKQDGVRLPWERITSVTALDREQAESRVTATRVLVLGALAWVAKKEKTNSFIEIVDADGVWIFAVPNLSAVELRAGLEPIARRYVRPSAHGSPLAQLSPGDAASRLERLRDLLERGLITAAEHDERRAAIIAEL